MLAEFRLESRPILIPISWETLDRKEFLNLIFHMDILTKSNQEKLADWAVNDIMMMESRIPSSTLDFWKDWRVGFRFWRNKINLYREG